MDSRVSEPLSYEMREELRRRIDAVRRATLAASTCPSGYGPGGRGTYESGYRAGCRCRDCTDAQTRESNRRRSLRRARARMMA